MVTAALPATADHLSPSPLESIRTRGARSRWLNIGQMRSALRRQEPCILVVSLLRLTT